MAKKRITGAELKAFYFDDEFWFNSSDAVWHEDVILEVNGVTMEEDFSIHEDLKDDDLVSILGGEVVSILPDFDGCSFETFFKRWAKKQSTVYLAVQVPKDKLEAVREAIKAAGGTVK